MLIETADFGQIEIREQDIIHFPSGIFAFEDKKDYVLINLDDDGDNSSVMCLQSVDDLHPAFAVFDPYQIVREYNPELLDKDLRLIDGDNRDDLRFLVIGVIPEDIRQAVVNLKSPLVINTTNHKGMQVILEGQDYPIRYRIFSQG